MGCGASLPAGAEREADDDAFVRGLLPYGTSPDAPRPSYTRSGTRRSSPR